MPPQKIFEVPFLLAIGMLAIMFFSVILPMLILPRIVPQITTDAHPESRWLDGLRGIASAIVALNHAPLVIINLQVTPKVFGYKGKALELFNFTGSIGVQIFFCITGMLFARKILMSEQIDWTDFFRKRMRRIVPAYFFACSVALSIAAWYSWPVTQPLTKILASIPSVLSFGLMPLPTINGFDFGRLLGVNWTLAIEWRYYLTLPLVFVLIRDHRHLAIAFLVLFAILDSTITGSSSWVYFVSGAICAPMMKRQFSDKTRAWGLATLFSTMLLYALFWRKFPNYGYERWLLMTVLFASIVVVRPGVLSKRPIVAMGTVSYSFYLLHCLVLFFIFEFARIHLFDVSNMDVLSFTMMTGGTLAIATILSTATYVFIERPFMYAKKTL